MCFQVGMTVRGLKWEGSSLKWQHFCDSESVCQVPKWANSDMLDIQDKRYWRWRLGRFKTDSVQGRFWWEEVRGDFIEVQVILINLCRFEWYVELILGLKLELTLPNNIIFNLWLLKLAPFVSQNFLTRMQKNKPFPFFFFLFSIDLF